MKVSAVDVLVVIRAPLEQYPPSLNQVALFSEAGLRVVVLDTYHCDYPEYRFRRPENVQRIHGGGHAQMISEKAPSLVQRISRSLKFQWKVKRLIRSINPSVVIGYDPNAISAIGKSWRMVGGPRLIWHFHELFLPRIAGGGFLTKRAVEFAAKYVDRPDLVIFPDANRASHYRKEIGKKFTSLIAMNCPRRLDQLPKSALSQSLGRKNGSLDAPIVYFQGWIGPSRCLEVIIESMNQWPESVLLVLVGPVSASYKEDLLEMATRRGVHGRVIFLGKVPYSELNSLAVGATIGLAIVSDAVEKDPSWKYSAGAVNKRFEYMAAGIPQIANSGTGMEEIIKNPGCGRLVNADQPAEIGKTISEMLADRKQLREMAQRSREAHLNRFCYEIQCEQLLEKVITWCNT